MKAAAHLHLAKLAWASRIFLSQVQGWRNNHYLDSAVFMVEAGWREWAEDALQSSPGNLNTVPPAYIPFVKASLMAEPKVSGGEVV